MKKQTVNTITTIVGLLIWLAIIPVAFFIEKNLGVIIPAFLFVGLVAIYFKNNDAQALLKNYFEKFLR